MRYVNLLLPTQISGKGPALASSSTLFDAISRRLEELEFTVRGRAYQERIRVSVFSPLVKELWVGMEPDGDTAWCGRT